jgi:hypothetical protein
VTRDEAIDHIWDLSDGMAAEFFCTSAQEDELRQKTREALAALGVLK